MMRVLSDQSVVTNSIPLHNLLARPSPVVNRERLSTDLTYSTCFNVPVDNTIIGTTTGTVFLIRKDFSVPYCY